MSNMKGRLIMVSVGLGSVLAPFSDITVILFLTLSAIMFDWITGVTAAAINAELESRIGIAGIFKKVQYIFTIVVAIILDVLIAQGMPIVGVDESFFGGALITSIVCVWMILNELISILENLDRGGVPLPDFLGKFIRKIKDKMDENLK